MSNPLQVHLGKDMTCSAERSVDLELVDGTMGLDDLERDFGDWLVPISRVARVGFEAAGSLLVSPCGRAIREEWDVALEAEANGELRRAARAREGEA